MKGILWGIAVVILVDISIGVAYGTLLVIQFYDPNEDIDYIKLSILVEMAKHASQIQLSFALSTLPFLLGGYVGAKKSKRNGNRSAIVIATLFCAPTAYSMYSGLSEFAKHEDLLFIILTIASSLIGAYLFTRKSIEGARAILL